MLAAKDFPLTLRILWVREELINMITTFSSPHDIFGASRGDGGIVFVGTVRTRLLFEISRI